MVDQRALGGETTNVEMAVAYACTTTAGQMGDLVECVVS